MFVLQTETLNVGGKSLKTIGFIGIDCTDIVVYFARMVNATGKKVGIVDCSIHKNLMRTVALPEELVKGNGYYKEILILSGETDNDADLKAQDMVIYYFESNINHAHIAQCTDFVFVSDMVLSHAQWFKNLSVGDIPKIMLIHNAVSVKYSENYLITQTGQEFQKEDIFIIPYEERDVRSKCYLCMDKMHRLTKLSSGMKSVILNLFLRYIETEYTGKELTQLLKVA